MLVELSTLQGTPTASASRVVAQWRVGAIVEATAVRDVITGQLSLAIGNLRLPARIASGIPAGPANGEQLQLRVLRTSPVLALESLATPARTTDADDTVADALRVNVPRQSSPTPLLANLATLAAAEGAGDSLPKTVLAAVSRLWQSVANAAELGDEKGLAAALQRSGVFLEAQLAQVSPASADTLLGTDFKALLLGLKQALTEAGAHPASMARNSLPPAPLPTMYGSLSPLTAATATLHANESAQAKLDALAQQVDGTLARLTTMQLMNSDASNAQQALLLELPLQREERSEVVRFKFARKQSSHYTAESGWTVDAALHLGDAGALHARVSLQGSRISVQLRADSAPVVMQLAARADELASTLRGAGLNVDRVACQHGSPPDDTFAPATSLLDVRA